MKIIRLMFYSLLICACTAASALSVNKSKIKNKKIFGIEFSNGTSFYGVAEWIGNISKQEYMVGPMLVTEVSMDMLGMGTQLRIYNAKLVSAEKVTEALKQKLPEQVRNKVNVPQSLAMQIAKAENKTSSLTQNSIVMKDYPATTHAKTLEFIVDDIDELETFYNKISSDFSGTPNKNSESANASKMPASVLTNEVGVAGKLYIIGALDDDVKESPGMLKSDSKAKNTKK